MVRTAAFLTGSDGKVSVFVTSGMLLIDVWAHGDANYPHEILGEQNYKRKPYLMKGSVWTSMTSHLSMPISIIFLVIKI